MKVVGYQSSKRFIAAPIPFERPEVKETQKEDVMGFKIRYYPTNPKSSTYELNLGVFKSGTPEEWLKHKSALNKILVGQNIQEPADKFCMARRVLEGDALAVFNNAAEDNEVTLETFNDCINAVTAHVFPSRALSTQKRYMRRYMRKPTDVKIREYVARVNEINSYLKEFPPFKQDQMLEEDEILDILEFGVPASWQKLMVQHGFNPTDHSTQEFIEMCERMEWTEVQESNHKGTKSKTNQNDGKGGKSQPKASEEADSKKKSNKKKKTREGTSYCIYHGVHGHDTGECKVVLAQAKKMRASYETHKENYRNDKEGSNYKIPKKVNYKDDSTKSNKKELYTLIQSMVKDTMKNETSKKHKEMESYCAEKTNHKRERDSESSSDSESDSDSSMHE
jgi:hypothetical protein